MGRVGLLEWVWGFGGWIWDQRGRQGRVGYGEVG